MAEATNKSGFTMTGTVSSNKMTNTVIVEVSQVKVHPKYHKRYTVTNKFVADTAGVMYAIGDKVQIVETRPMSKTKRFKVVKKA
jgi:small subunit ribosomal protein S17